MSWILDNFYKHWAKTCLPAALFTTIILLSSRQQIGPVMFWVWIQLPIYLLHEFEEHSYPGGFQHCINTLIFQSSNPNNPLDERNIFWINIPAIWIIFPLFAILAQNWDLHFGAVLPYFGLFNATTHIIFGIIKRAYLPGLWASIFLNYPAGIYALIVMSDHHVLGWVTTTLSLLFVLVAHAIIAIYAIRRRQSPPVV